MERKSIEQFWQGGKQQYIHTYECMCNNKCKKPVFFYLYICYFSLDTFSPFTFPATKKARNEC